MKSLLRSRRIFWLSFAMGLIALLPPPFGVASLLWVPIAAIHIRDARGTESRPQAIMEVAMGSLLFLITVGVGFLLLDWIRHFIEKGA
jgi:hypothetical protein